jgi:hypothetical protein
LRQACIAAWNCGESGLTFPLISTPKMERVRFDALAAEPTDAANPCELKHAANAASLGCVDFAAPTPVVVVVSRLATEGDFEPPQPATAAVSSVSTAARASV